MLDYIIAIIAIIIIKFKVKLFNSILIKQLVVMVKYLINVL
jgi:hypothetical protein